MIDLSQDIYHNCPGVPAFPPPQVEYMKIGARDGWTVERITMSLHTATHMDAPSHLAPYHTTLDQIPVDRFQGELVLVDLRHKGHSEAVTPEDLESYAHRLSPDSVTLLYTGWGEKRSWSKEWLYESPYLGCGAARLLTERGVRGVGIDHFSIGGTGETNEDTHRILLSAGVWIAEGLQLDHTELWQGFWHVMALPIKVRDSSGAPARVVAVQYG